MIGRTKSVGGDLGLIERFGEGTYSEARKRQHDAPDIVDANRPEHHWEHVKEAIRRIEARR